MTVLYSKDDIFVKRIKKNPRKPRYTKVHKQRASFFLHIFVFFDNI
jgi:hypothetical protein